jgi:hypothetical protein
MVSKGSKASRAKTYTRLDVLDALCIKRCTRRHAPIDYVDVTTETARDYSAEVVCAYRGTDGRV